MITMELYCNRCKNYTSHMINPWADKPNQFSAVSIMCTSCTRLAIAELDKLPVIEVKIGPTSADMHIADAQD